jgi:hypothetical protein
MSGVIHPLPQYAFMAWCLVKAQGPLYLYLINISKKAYYLEILKQLHEAVRRRKSAHRFMDWILHLDNAPAHKVLSVKQFLAQKSSTELEHLPCSLIWIRMISGSIKK